MIWKKINTRQKRLWKPIITEMGPHWHIVTARCGLRTRKALIGRGIAEFRVIGTGRHLMVYGRLTGLGVMIRDRWISTDAIDEDKRLRRKRCD